MSKKPALTATTPRLTDLFGPKHPFVCQSCGNSNKPGFGAGIMRLTLTRWQEHDHEDQPENKIVILCDKCTRQLIERHPRLYRDLQPNEPWPGTMAICVGCIHREDLKCPLAKMNGGPGVFVKVEPPSMAMVDGVGFRGPMKLWAHAPTGCSKLEGRS